MYIHSCYTPLRSRHLPSLPKAELIVKKFNTTLVQEIARPHRATRSICGEAMFSTRDVLATRAAHIEPPIDVGQTLGSGQFCPDLLDHHETKTLACMTHSLT